MATVLTVNPDGPAKVIDVDVASNHCDAYAKSKKRMNDDQCGMNVIHLNAQCRSDGAAWNAACLQEV